MGATISISKELSWEVPPASWRGVVDYVETARLENASLKNAFSTLPLARSIKFLSIEEVDCDGISEFRKLVGNLKSDSPSILVHWSDPSYLPEFESDLDRLLTLLSQLEGGAETERGANKTLDTNT